MPQIIVTETLPVSNPDSAPWEVRPTVIIPGGGGHGAVKGRGMRKLLYSVARRVLRQGMIGIRRNRCSSSWSFAPQWGSSLNTKTWTTVWAIYQFKDLVTSLVNEWLSYLLSDWITDSTCIDWQLIKTFLTDWLTDLAKLHTNMAYWFIDLLSDRLIYCATVCLLHWPSSALTE